VEAMMVAAAMVVAVVAVAMVVAVTTDSLANDAELNQPIALRRARTASDIA
jgi:hypothetical protein